MKMMEYLPQVEAYAYQMSSTWCMVPLLVILPSLNKMAFIRSYMIFKNMLLIEKLIHSQYYPKIVSNKKAGE